MKDIDLDPPLKTARRRSSSIWIVSLFSASILFQRLSLPGGVIPLLLPLVLGWCAYGLNEHVLELDRRRTSLFLIAAAATAGAALAQQILVADPLISLTSWGLLFAVWAPAALRLTNRSRAEIRLAFLGCARAGVVLAWGTILMIASQFLGLRYEDYLAEFFPEDLLLQGYVITYPMEYGSAIYRGNAWIGLEPSIVSLQLGLCIVLALLARAGLPTLISLIAGMACTVSGSGVFVVAVGLAVMLISPTRGQIVRYLLAMGVTLVLLLRTPMGQQMWSRITEADSRNSSTSLRAIEPYRFLWPQWASDSAVAILGRGAGASQDLITATNRSGLLVPSPIKVLFDYGLLAGSLLALFLFASYLGGPSRAVAVSLLGSSWLLQPGTTTLVLALPTMLFVTWWSPRGGLPLEVDPLSASPEGLSSAPDKEQSKTPVGGQVALSRPP